MHETGQDDLERGAAWASSGWVGGQEPELPRFLSKAACVELARRAARTVRDGGITQLTVTSDWVGELRWARNRAGAGSARRYHWLTVVRAYDITGVGARGVSIALNQLDTTSIAAAVHRAESLIGDVIVEAPRHIPEPIGVYAHPAIWSEATYRQGPATRGALVRQLIAPAAQAGMRSAGYLNVAARGTALLDLRQPDRVLYAPQTFAQCSITTRDPAGQGSGWAGGSAYDWAKFDPEKIASVALEKCLASRNAVRLEPGRYTTILEPQASFDFLGHLLGSSRLSQELPFGTYFKTKQLITYQGQRKFVGLSKLGEQIVDERVTIRHDPADPELGVIPFDPGGEPYRPVTWIDKGVLTTLPYDRGYAVGTLREPLGFPFSGGFRMDGGPTPIEEMITSTKRGLLVTRFSGVQSLDGRSLLLTGYTRDGLWLVEDGKISKPVKNFRFTESPLFALNGLEQLGPTTPVFYPEQPAIVPPVKVREFSFTSLSDAV